MHYRYPRLVEKLYGVREVWKEVARTTQMQHVRKMPILQVSFDKNSTYAL